MYLLTLKMLYESLDCASECRWSKQEVGIIKKDLDAAIVPLECQTLTPEQLFISVETCKQCSNPRERRAETMLRENISYFNLSSYFSTPLDFKDPEEKHHNPPCSSWPRLTTLEFCTRTWARPTTPKNVSSNWWH